MSVRQGVNSNLVALNEMLGKNSGVFLVHVHNRRIVKVAEVDRGKTVEELLALSGGEDAEV